MSLPPSNLVKSDDEFTRAYLPNELNNYDSVAYNLKFFMVSDESVKSGELFNPSTQRIIAATGLTPDISIESFTVDHIQGYSQAVQAGTSVSFEMDLQQIMGADLMDRILNFSRELEVKNYLKCVYFIELYFNAVHPTTGAPMPELSSKRWLWQVYITNVEININSGGASYRFTGVTKDDLGYTNQTDLEGSTQIEAKNVSEYFKKLADRLNRVESNDKSKNAQVVPDQYEFDIDPIIGKFKLGGANDSIDSTTTTKFDELDLSIKSPAFAHGTSVSDLIVNVVAGCFEMQILAKNQDSAEETVLEEAKSAAKAFKKLIKIHSHVTQLGYDSGRGEYAKKIKYIVTLYDIARLILQQGEFEQTPNSMQKKYDELLKTKRLIKRYDYIYSGLNDQVLDLSIDFKTSWFVPLPKQGGTTDRDNVVTGQSKAETEVGKTAREQKMPNQAKQMGMVAETNDETASSLGVGLPLTGKTSDVQGSRNSGVEGAKGNGDKAFGVLFEQASMGADLVAVEMVVRGDPHFLPAPYQNTTRTTSTLSGTSYSTLEKYQTGENYVLINYNVPVEYNPETGYAEIYKSSAVFSGVYGIITVKHTFSGGEYTQTLDMVREKLIQIDKIKTGGKI